MLYKRENASIDLFSEMLPLLESHYHEIAHYKDIKLAPNFEKYEAMDRVGLLRIFTARDDVSGEMIGYCCFFFANNLHYKDSLQAVQDVVFLEKSKRGAGAGKEFIDWCDSELKNEGAQVVYHHVKNKHNFGPMLETLGYELVDLIYARRLN